MKSQDQRQESIERLEQLIEGFQVAMLTTIDEEGRLRSRPMMTQYARFDGNLWFFTRAHARKVPEIKLQGQVNISYASWEESRYVSVSGTAELVRDLRQIRELWNPIFKDWFPQGLNDPDLALLKVKVEKAEYWDRQASAMLDLVGLGEPPVRRGGQP